ncbi:MAG: serine/threonine-protein phosphatase [Lachnospiraceae bacterium]|nr:serine/threonine-protein phosphatase [Lachnospiraceae bacterium]
MNNITYSKLSECGPLRKINQDSILILTHDEMSLFCIADGMGGLSEGEKASSLMTERLSAWWSAHSDMLYEKNMGQIADGLESVISDVNRELYEYGLSNQQCGTTASILCVSKNMYFILSVGDSRIYMRNKRDFHQLTKDEIWSNQWIIEPRSGVKIPDNKYGMLLNAIGTDKTIIAQRMGGFFEKGSVFLICSDGLYKFCDDRYIKKAMKYSKESVLDRRIGFLKEKVLKNGEKDNLSIIMIKIDDVR